MSLFHKNVQTNPEIENAMKYLETIHPASHLIFGSEPYHYLRSSHNEDYVRHYFYKGHEKRLFYIVLSGEEISKLEKYIESKKGEIYTYQDTILNNLDDNGILHRFHIPGVESSTIFLTDSGEIKDVIFSKPD